MGEAISHLKDVKKNCYSLKEHTFRVMNREGIPWQETDGLYPSFQNRKDTFIQKYQILLDHQEMLEKRISGLPTGNKNIESNQNLSLNKSKSEIQIQAIEYPNNSGALEAIEEGTPQPIPIKSKPPKNENYFQKINRENREYQDNLKKYFDSYFDKVRDKETIKYEPIECNYTEEEIITNEFPSLFKTSRLNKGN